MIGNGGSESRRSTTGPPQDAVHGIVAEAIQGVEEQIERTRGAARSEERLGSLLAIEGRWDEAVRRFESASARRPSSFRARVNLAHARIEGLGADPESAWRSLDAAPSIAPPMPYAAYVAAWRSLRNGEGETALALLIALTSASRFRLWGQLALAHFLEAAGCAQRATRARADLARLHPLFRDPALEESGDAGCRVPLVTGSPRSTSFWNPLLAEGHWVAARHALSRGLWRRAREQLGAAFLCDPWPDRLELALASLARRSGEEEEVLVHLSQALSERPCSAGVRLALGLEYARQGYLIEAAGQLSTAWRLPGWPGRQAEHPSGLAALDAQGHEARRNFRQALRLGDRPQGELRLGYLCLLLGLRRHQEALQQVEFLDKEAGESADLLYCRGEALAGLGSPGEAAACVSRALDLGGSRRIAFDLLDLVCRARAGIQEACIPEGS
jgi:tetratricopeptide (TPR) repeat protein